VELIAELLLFEVLLPLPVSADDFVTVLLQPHTEVCLLRERERERERGREREILFECDVRVSV
jgi:hypothetical protein